MSVLSDMSNLGRTPVTIPGAKRARLHVGETSSAGSVGATSSAAVVNGTHHPIRKTFSRGAVVKLRLENFLTFDRVVINPKPQLNVIVGPNGTGKSSIVCAICIGLGGSTTLLGRAKDLKDFVKHGKDNGFVEITLYDDKAARNPVIRRSISASNNSSEWTINRKQVQEKEVKKLVESLNIQLGNRCMFLPQDKVIEFARMNKQELLMETERAVGPKELSQYHEELKGLKSTYSQSCETLRRIKKELESCKRENSFLQRDVERYQNKERYERDIKDLIMKKFWVEYEEARHVLDVKKRERKQANEELKALKKDYQPIKDRHRAQEEAVERYKAAALEETGNVRGAGRRLRAEQEKLTALEDKVEDARRQLENAKKEEENRKKKMATFQNEIEGFRRQLEELEPIESLKQKIVDKNASIRAIQVEIGELTEQLRERMGENQVHEDKIRQGKDELQHMEDVQTQRLQKLEQMRESATVQVIHWLKENQHRFRQPILEPVCMSLNMLDPNYTKQAEAFFRGKDFLSFVAQNEEDKEIFLKEVRDSMRLKVNIVRAPGRPLQDFKPGIPLEVLQEYGFQQLLLDVVEAPEPVLAFFCQYHYLHHVPVAGRLRPRDVDRITSELQDLRRFFTADMQYSVKKSLYRNATSTRSNELYAPQFLVASVDTQKKEELKAMIQEEHRVLAGLQRHCQDLRGKDQRLRKQDMKLRSEKQDLRKLCEAHQSLRSNITTRETKLRQCRETTFNLEEEEEKCDQEINRIQQERVQSMGKQSQLLKACIARTDDCVKAHLLVRTAEKRVGFFLWQYHQAKTLYEDAEHKLQRLTDEEKGARDQAKHCLDRASRETGMKEPDEQLKNKFKMFPNDLQELEDKIHDLRAKAEMCTVTDRSIIDEYKNREKKIEKLTGEVEKMKGDLSTRDDRIKELKQRWLGPLKQLIGQVNDCFRGYFSQHMSMESAGEVRLDPDPEEQPDFSDFDKYGVQIKVKFRDSDQLHELDAQRQSGGERSVSTMLYLMALQGNTSCPFRVVDEINQGMDPINERRIFNLIVQTAYTGAQYFLLTPKLLQNLEYSEAVAIHLVHNGQEMAPCDSWNLAKILA